MSVWLMTVIPNWVFYLVLLIGVLGIVLSFFLKIIPFVNVYRLQLQLLSVVLTVIGVWFAGAIHTQNIWEDKVEKQRIKNEIAEQRSKDLNDELQDQIRENEKLRREKEDAEKKIITKYIMQYDPMCKLSNGFIWLHNSASQDRVPQSPEGIVGGTSDVKASELLETVVSNYNMCFDMRDKLIKWQKWYREQKEIFEKAQ